jgi:hypothetical protein
MGAFREFFRKGGGDILLSNLRKTEALFAVECIGGEKDL